MIMLIIRAIPNLLYLLFFLVLVWGCKQDVINEKAVEEQKEIREARQYFEQEIDNEISGSTSQRNPGKGLFKKDLLQSLNWEQAHVREITTGEAIFIPITCDKNYYTPKGDYSIALNQMSYITMYRDETDNFQYNPG